MTKEIAWLHDSKTKSILNLSKSQGGFLMADCPWSDLGFSNG